MNYIILTTAFLALNAEQMATALATCDHAQLAAEISAFNVEKRITLENLAKADEELSITKKDLADALCLNEKHQAVIEELSKAPSAIVEKVADKAASFVREGVEYIFSLPAILHKGQKVTPTEVCADTSLQDELIKIGSGMITAK